MDTTDRGKCVTEKTFLNNQVFKEAVPKKEPTFGLTSFENKVVLVVDGPRLADTVINFGQDMEASAKNMSPKLAMCCGLDAFLFVTRFDNKFTPKETEALDDIKKIFRDDFFEHMIVVVSCGDRLRRSAIEEEGRTISVYDWRKEQKEIFQKLYKEWVGHVVLFNNRERDEEKRREQRRKVVHVAEGLNKRLFLNTSQCFHQAEYEGEKPAIETQGPAFEERTLRKDASFD